MSTFNQNVKTILSETAGVKKSALPELSPDQTHQFFLRLSSGKYNIFKSSPFLGNILQRLKTVATYDVDTMGVDDKGNIYINPHYGMSLKFDEFQGVLAHETMHIATLTFYRQKGRDHKIWNIATDFIMNRDLLRSGFKLPEEGCIPKNDTVSFKSGKTGKTITVNVADASAERLYTQLIKHAGVDLSQPFDTVIEGTPGDEKEGDGKPGGSGKKVIKPIEGSDQPGSKSNAQIKNDILTSSEAAKAHEDQKEKDRGSASGGLRETVLKHATPRVNWRQILKNIVAKTITEYDMRRPDKRAWASGYYAPRVVSQDSLAPICVAIDTSGSITDKELNVFVTETLNIFKQYSRAQITIVLMHTEAYYSITITRGNVSSVISDLKAHWQSGGNEMGCVANWLTKTGNNKKVAAVVYLTDGWVEHNPIILPRPVKNFALVTDDSGLKHLSSTPNLTCYHIDID